MTCLTLAGASTGAGLGNAFLSHVRAVDAIFQVVRAFDDAEVIHVEGDVNPIRDMEIIQNELRLKDIDWVRSSSSCRDAGLSISLPDRPGPPLLSNNRPRRPSHSSRRSSAVPAETVSRTRPRRRSSYVSPLPPPLPLSDSLLTHSSFFFSPAQSTMEKVLKFLSEDKRDLRKGNWNNKEVSRLPFISARRHY